MRSFSAGGVSIVVVALVLAVVTVVLLVWFLWPNLLLNRAGANWKIPYLFE